MTKKQQFAFASLFAAMLLNPVTSVGSQNETHPTGASAPSGVPSSLIQMGIQSNYYSPYAFVVNKKARTLSVWFQDKNEYKKVAEYPADMGKKAGAKKFMNDHRTPEGIYFFQEKLEGHGLDFSLYGKRAFTTDYPNFFDRLDGKTGYGIWLHAVPDTVALTRGSRGCVVIRNDAILDATQYVKLSKTPIIINDDVEMLGPDQLKERSQQISQLVEGWRQSWEKKDIDAYISFYSPKFTSMKMGRDQWKEYKANLNSTYKFIAVKLSRPVIYAYKDKAIVRFLQAYTSDLRSDFGEKRLFLVNEDGTYRILGEEWAEETSRLAREEIDGYSTTAVSASQPPFVNKN